MEMITLGTVIFTEFRKPGLSPLQSRPVQALNQASIHGWTVGSAGRLKRWPSLISGMPFSDVMIMM